MSGYFEIEEEILEMRVEQVNSLARDFGEIIISRFGRVQKCSGMGYETRLGRVF